MKTSQDEIVLICYRNAVKNANTPIGHNIAFLRNTLGIDIDNNEITPDIRLPKVYSTNKQRVLLFNLKLLKKLVEMETLLYLIYQLMKLNV